MSRWRLWMLGVASCAAALLLGGFLVVGTAWAEESSPPDASSEPTGSAEPSPSSPEPSSFPQMSPDPGSGPESSPSPTDADVSVVYVELGPEAAQWATGFAVAAVMGTAGLWLHVVGSWGR
jgi:hypothetical protein